MYQSSSEGEQYLQLPDVKLAPLHFAKIIQSRGTLPTGVTLADALRQLMSGTGAPLPEIVQLVSCDPVLSLRLIAAANSEKFRAGRPGITLQESIGRIGPARLQECLYEISEVKPMSSVFHGRGIASTVFQQLLLTGILSRRISKILIPDLEDHSMAAILAGGYLMSQAICAYSRPNYFAGCVVNAQASDKGSLGKELRRLFGAQPAGVSEAILEKLGLPEDFRAAVADMHVSPWNRRAWKGGSFKHSESFLSASYIADQIATELVTLGGEDQLKKVIRLNFSKAKLPRGSNDNLLQGIVNQFLSETTLFGLCPLRLPSYLRDDDPDEVASPLVERFPAQLPSINERINPFLYELRACFMTRPAGEFHRFSQVIFSTLLALVRGMNFDRAMYFAYAAQSQMLAPVFIFGKPVSSPEVLTRFVRHDDLRETPHIEACFERRAIFHGDPLIRDHWPFVAFPAYSGDELLGVFYADMEERSDGEGLSVDEQVACIAISEEWHAVNPAFF